MVQPLFQNLDGRLRLSLLAPQLAEQQVGSKVGRLQLDRLLQIPDRLLALLLSFQQHPVAQQLNRPPLGVHGQRKLDGGTFRSQPEGGVQIVLDAFQLVDRAITGSSQVRFGLVRVGGDGPIDDRIGQLAALGLGQIPLGSLQQIHLGPIEVRQLDRQLDIGRIPLGGQFERGADGADHRRQPVERLELVASEQRPGQDSPAFRILVVLLQNLHGRLRGGQQARLDIAAQRLGGRVERLHLEARDLQQQCPQAAIQVCFLRRRGRSHGLRIQLDRSQLAADIRRQGIVGRGQGDARFGVVRLDLQVLVDPLGGLEQFAFGFEQAGLFEQFGRQAIDLVAMPEKG